MPRETIARINASLTGAELTLVPANDTDGLQFQNNGYQALIVNNAGASAVTVTVPMAPDQFGRTGNTTVSVAAGDQVAIGPFQPTPYNHDNYVFVDFSTDVDVTVGVISLQS